VVRVEWVRRQFLLILPRSLSESGYNVGLLDLDIHGPDVVRMLGGNALPSVGEDERMIPAQVLPNLKALSISMLVEEGKPIIWRGPLKHSAIKQFLEDTDWGKLDYLLSICHRERAMKH